ncbi:hypothetical protein SJI19_19520 [Acerihabitans sp. TG2]|uniref:hypothetical protein n=1 Tax=Acerihabitans sp. TG2 TaxID=3096008 RepID=UPI002B23A981|nr:hypothetical protein [Acerihabitans sp. TG2]MEA9392698.1 hypothetical protein [Acerihabitans sp. TG2]
MSHCVKDNNDIDKTKRFATTVRMDETDKNGLREMTKEHPLYTESVVIRAALQTFLTLSTELRTKIILASLNECDIRSVLRRGVGILKKGGTL